MLKRYLFETIKWWTLKLTPVSHDQLIDLGFNVDELFYRLTDLNIYVQNDKYCYYTPDAEVHRIKNMFQVSNLIFGKIDYLRI